MNLQLGIIGCGAFMCAAYLAKQARSSSAHWLMVIGWCAFSLGGIMEAAALIFPVSATATK